MPQSSFVYWRREMNEREEIAITGLIGARLMMAITAVAEYQTGDLAP